MFALLLGFSVACAAITLALLGGYLLAILTTLRRIGSVEGSHLARLAAVLEGTVRRTAELPVRLEALEHRLDELRGALAAVQEDLEVAARPLSGDPGVVAGR